MQTIINILNIYAYAEKKFLELSFAALLLRSTDRSHLQIALLKITSL